MRYDQLNPHQKQAVLHPGSALVSAAAGSGKTAVLVLRLITEMTRADKPLDADRLVVVTFTEAAAGEMRSRLESGLDAYCRDHPGDGYALQQKLLLQSASIGTIDSFCIRLIREHFERAGVDPDFAVADERDLILLRQTVLQSLVNRWLGEADETLTGLMRVLGCDYDAAPLTEAVKRIAAQADTVPYPYSWLNQQIERCDTFDGWVETACRRVVVMCRNLWQMADRFGRLAEENRCMTDTIQKYADGWKAVCDRRIETAGLGDYDALRTQLNQRAGALKLDKEHPLYDALTKRKEELLKYNRRIVSLLARTYEEEHAVFCKSAAYLKRLLQYTEQYMQGLDALKQQKGLMTFADCEHKALSLFAVEQEGQAVLRPDAVDLVGSWDEVLVDEYQDVNDLQDCLFRLMSDNGKHLFLVGDVKQSIYGFRGADPSCFLKCRAAGKPADQCVEPSDMAAIYLNHNYRSKKGICGFINDVFDWLMTKENGGLDYVATERLQARGDATPLTADATHVHLLPYNPDLPYETNEARHVADTIVSLMQEGLTVPTNKEDGPVRPLRYGDIAVLVRSLKGFGSVLTAELSARGIPVATMGHLFLEAEEVQWVMNLLALISNASDDYYLLCTMMSPLYGFTAEETAQMRIGQPSLGAGLRQKAESDTKAAHFMADLQTFRRLASVLPLDRLLLRVYRHLSLRELVLMMPGGSTKKANLDLLCREAGEYEQRIGGGIRGFLRYLTTCYDNREGASGMVTEDCVTVQTMHKSKGLQYPVVILPNLTKAFNRRDLDESLFVDSELGLAIRSEPHQPKDKSPLSRRLVQTAYVRRAQEEELRLLYVAMTRAEQRLVVVLGTKDLSKSLNAAVNAIGLDGEMKNEAYESAKSFSDFLFPALLRHPAGGLLRDLSGAPVPVCGAEQTFVMRLCEVSDLTVAQDPTVPDEPDETLYETMRQQFAYVYPYAALRHVPTKANVSDLTHRAYDSQYAFTAVPGFLQQAGLTAAEKGTAMHKVMQYLDYDKALKDLDAELERLYEWMYLSEAEYHSLNTEAVAAFLRSDLFARMRRSSHMERERQFVIGLPANRFQPDLSGESAEETVVLQGAIDCLFTEEDGIVLVDFKTDRVSTAEELVTRYAVQLDLYAEAAARLYGLPVKEKILYSLHLSQTVTV